MRRESHVRFCERAAVRFHRATHLETTFAAMTRQRPDAILMVTDVLQR